ncbi:MAG: signal peptidase II [Desulfobacterales bacterium]|nr:signal peptidase II [Desulfobacterales bacterium]
MADKKKLFIIAGLVVFLDQITKVLILKALPIYHSIPVIPGFFSITHIHNAGGAFGFLADYSPSIRSIVFLFASSLAVGLIYYFYKNIPQTHSFLATGFALIFGGAIGNLIDRIRLSVVVDFLDFYIKNIHWPAFNIADSAITIGIFIFMFHLIFKKLPR